MFSKKNILALTCVWIISLQLPVFADDLSDMKALLNDTVTKLIQKYEARIQSLETENNNLKQEINTLKGATIAPVVTPLVSSTPALPVAIPATSNSGAYNSVIKQVNTNLNSILSENNLPAYSTVGLFEFMEPNAVFVSFDDGNNPAWVTAFKSKILYTFDTNMVFTKIGLFDLDYASQKYRTLFGSNPYAKSARTRVQNPLYKGKLFDTVTSTGTTVTSASITPANTTASTEVTLAQIKTAYDKTKLLDAIKLSDVYIVKNPNDLDVLRIRYRSYYIIGKYENSLTEIKKIEGIQGPTFERTIACDAAVIGKIAKKTEVSTYYSAICKKK